jgi:hypothetical protein
LTCGDCRSGRPAVDLYVILVGIAGHGLARVPGADLEHGVGADEVGSRSAPDFGAGWRRLTTVRRAWRRIAQRHRRPPMISSVEPRGGIIDSVLVHHVSGACLCHGLCRRRGTRRRVPGPASWRRADVGVWAVVGPYVAGGVRPRRHRDYRHRDYGSRTCACPRWDTTQMGTGQSTVVSTSGLR